MSQNMTLVALVESNNISSPRTRKLNDTNINKDHEDDIKERHKGKVKKEKQNDEKYFEDDDSIRSI